MPTQPTDAAQPQLTRLLEFRQDLYKCLTRACDALFELIDALLLTPQLTSFPELSSTTVFRRQWSSLYEALQDGQLDRDLLLKLFVENLPSLSPLLIVGDHTAWARPYARTMPERTIEHQPTPIKGQKPITVGYGFSTLGVVPQEAGSWFLPLLHERITPDQSPRSKMIAQLTSVVALLPAPPLVLLDSEYGNSEFFKDSSPVECDLLVRLRTNLSLPRRPPPYSGKGRPPLHGEAFRLKDPKTWGKPAETLETNDPGLGRVRVQMWRDLHFRKASKRWFDLIRIERLDEFGTKRKPKVVWLAWCGKLCLPLLELWPRYLRRYAVEHWYRFINRSLHWKLPKLSTPPQCELWSEVIVIASWQLWLARSVISQQVRPWQKRQPQPAAGRVHQSLGGLFAVIGTPTKCPKPRGKSPGWEKGRPRTKRTRHEVVKKTKQKGAQSANQPP